MKFALNHLWASLRDLAKQSPFLLALIAIFSCTPLYMNQDWFEPIDLGLYILYFVIIILQSYITRDRKYSILYTLSSIIISIGLYTIHETYYTIRGIEFATENLSYLWLYSMITLYFTSPSEHYIGEIINRLKRIGITIVTSILYNIIIFMSLWFLFIILGEAFPFEETTFKVLASLNLFICTTMICSYKESPDGPPAPSSFFNLVFGVFIPKASIVTGLLANIYLVLILLGIREDTRFLYTYYPYVSIFYLFYLASFRSSYKSKTQQILCLLFITLTTLCLILIGKRVINEPVLWLNTIYVGLFNLIFLGYNIYSLTKRLTPSVHTSIMALALGAVLLMPAIGYTSYHEFTTYTRDGKSYKLHFEIVRTFSPDYDDYRKELEDEKVKQEEAIDLEVHQLVDFTVQNKPHTIDVTGYDKFAPDVSLRFFDVPKQSTEDIVADYGAIKFSFLNEGKDLEVSFPNGVTETHHIYDLLKNGPKDDSQPFTIEGKGYKLNIYRYYAKDYGTRIITFSVLYK